MLVAFFGLFSTPRSPPDRARKGVQVGSHSSDPFAPLKLVELYKDVRNLTAVTDALVNVEVTVAKFKDYTGKGATICSKHHYLMHSIPYRLLDVKKATDDPPRPLASTRPRQQQHSEHSQDVGHQQSNHFVRVHLTLSGGLNVSDMGSPPVLDRSHRDSGEMNELSQALILGIRILCLT